jgi:DNA-directed RNA polymerase specialized sigma24 family protein
MAPQRQYPRSDEQDARRDAAKDLVAALFTQWYGPMVRYACRATGVFAAAEDLVQASFTELYRALLEGTAVANPKGWILCVVRREIVDRIREERRHGGRRRTGRLRTAAVAWRRISSDGQRPDAPLEGLVRGRRSCCWASRQYRQIAVELNIDQLGGRRRGAPYGNAAGSLGAAGQERHRDRMASLFSAPLQ